MDPTARGLELKVGALVLASAAILLGFVFVVGNPSVGPGIRLSVDYAFVGPIKKGASVRVSGVTVGAVEDVEFMADRPASAGANHPVVRLHLFVQERAAPLLTRGAAFHVTTLGVLGEHYVDVIPGPASAPALAANDVVRGVDSPRTDMLMARMAQLLDQVGKVLDSGDAQLADMMGQAARLMVQLEAVLGNTDVTALLKDVQVTLQDARVVMDGARTVLRDPADLARTVGEGKAALAEGRVALSDLRQMLGEVKQDVPQAVQRTNNLLGQAETLTVRVDALLRAMEKAGLADDKRLSNLVTRSEAVMARADTLSTRADAMLAKIERGEGTVGKLMKDEAVYEDLKALLRDIRANPWKLMLPGR